MFRLTVDTYTGGVIFTSSVVLQSPDSIAIQRMLYTLYVSVCVCVSVAFVIFISFSGIPVISTLTYCTLYIVRCIMYSVRRTLYGVHCIVYGVHCIV